MTNDEKIEFLLKPEVLLFLDEIQNRCEDDLALSRSALLKPFSPAQRIALLEQRHLRKKGTRKFSFAHRLLFTKLGLEQSTGESISRYKANRIGRKFNLIADLCCGIGGSSFFLDAEVIGLDLDKPSVRIFVYNMKQLNKQAFAVQANAVNSCIKADMVLLDPSRRMSTASRSWDEAEMSPKLSEIKEICDTYHNLAIKLGPGFSVPEFLLESELEYIGIHDDCLELTAWIGEAGEKNTIRATEVKSGASLSVNREDLPDTFSSPEDPGQFLYEPVKVVIRSHLFGYLAQKHNLWQIDSRIAYLSGGRHINDPLLKSFRILKQLPFNLRTIKRELSKHDIGLLDIKKRGITLAPEKILRELNPQGSRQGILLFTRVKNQKTVFLMEALENP